ncbi:MAG: hypothetical protein IKF98_01610 [Clostridia bacterium]|nr:hypothetical protein [Clostridia bacterium]
MADLGTAYVNIVPKAPGIESNVEQLLSGGQAGAEKAGAGWGKKILGGLAAAGIGTAAVNLVKDAFEAGGALQQSFGGLDTIYEEASAAAKEYAINAAQAGISANDYAEQAVSFGAALKAAFGGDTAAAAAAANTAIMDMADNAAKMGTPLESLQNAYQGFAKGNFTMLDNLKLGYGGTQAEMERLLADAEKISGVKYDLTNLGDLYSAIHVIQGELNLTGVAAGEASSTLTGSMSAVKASWENVMAAMTTGENLETAMNNLSTSVGNFATNVFTMFGTLASQLPTLILGLVDVVIKNAPEFIKSGVEMIVQLGVGLVQAVPDIIAMIPELMQGVWDAITQIDWMSIGINIVNGIIDGLWDAAGGLWRSMQSLADSAWQSAKDFLGISSPSKVFAQQVGRWIPAGVAVGIDDNVGDVEDAVATMVDPASLQMPANAASFAPSSADTREDLARLLDAVRRIGFDLYLDGKQITAVVTARQKQIQRAGGAV